MEVRLVSHASVVVRASDTAIWTDPWLSSKAFNDSWSLLPAAKFDESLLGNVDYIWLSHEHPDHLNFPTLGSLPQEFKRRVTVLFHDNKPQRVFEPLRGLGYRNLKVLPHRRIVRLTPETRVYCYRVGTLDSCLGISNRNETIFNINDAEANSRDCGIVRRDLGPVDVLLKQFSLAVHDGSPDHATRLPVAARRVLETLSANHRDLGVKVTIPFASFMYFSCIDNKYMNAFANQPADVAELCESRNQQLAVLYPGDSYIVNRPYDSSPALEKYEKLYSTIEDLPYDVPPVVEFSQLAASFHELARTLHRRFPSVLLKRVPPLRVSIVDLGLTVELSIAQDSFKEAGGSLPDVIIYSQPLHYCFAFPWGLHTLTISARFRVINNMAVWKMHKMLAALNNAEVSLRVPHVFSRGNWEYLKNRISAVPRYGLF